jgi:hypothetical protein
MGGKLLLRIDGTEQAGSESNSVDDPLVAGFGILSVTGIQNSKN